MEVNVLGTVFKAKTRKVSATPEAKQKILEFGQEYWDNPDFPGCGGYFYDERWKEPAQRLVGHYNLTSGAKILDLCCGKGFLVYELHRINPKFELVGIDGSDYAVANAKEEVRHLISLGDATKIPFPDKYFDLVLCLNSLYILPLTSCSEALREISRVGKRQFITVNSYRDDAEKESLVRWDHSARTLKSVEEWKSFFGEIGYKGDYYWTIFLGESD